MRRWRLILYAVISLELPALIMEQLVKCYELFYDMATHYTSTASFITELVSIR